MTRETETAELLSLSEQLLKSIREHDWPTYEQLCDPSLSAFEPEGCGTLVHGLAFHQFYFEQCGVGGPQHVTLADPHVRLMGETAVVSYVRLVQRLAEGGAAVTDRWEETRVWHRRDGRWRHVHFHRSAAAL